MSVKLDMTRVYVGDSHSTNRGAANVFVLIATKYIGLLRNLGNQEGDKRLQPSWLE
jgi:hypothetical protein